MLGLSPWLSLLVVLVVALLARLLPEPRRSRGFASRSLRALDGRLAPIVIAVLTGLATWLVWGSLTRTAVVHATDLARLLSAESDPVRRAAFDLAGELTTQPVW